MSFITYIILFFSIIRTEVVSYCLTEDSCLTENSTMMKTAVREYMDYSTVHGIGRMKNSPFLVLKCVWVLALCGSLAMITWQVSTLYIKYKR